MKVKPGPVLYADYENNLAQAKGMLENIARYLGLPGVPKDFYYWNANYASPQFGTDHSILDIVRKVKPVLTCIDTLSAAFPDAEDSNKNANALFTDVRSVISEIQTTFFFTHHFGKSKNIGDCKTPFELLKNARGASALVNGSDLRLAVTEPSASRFADGECVFELSGFVRGGGQIPVISVGRVFDDDGVAIGYRRLTGTRLLQNEKYQAVFAALPHDFRAKDVEEHFPRSHSSAGAFIDACVSAHIIRKVVRGRYEKTIGVSGE